MDDVFVVTGEDIDEHDLEEDLLYPHAHRGEEISKYGIVHPEEKVIYPYESDEEGNAILIPEHRLESEYPNIHAYFEANKEELRQRRDSRKYYAKGPDWYRFLRQGRYDYIGVKKLLARGVAQESCVGLLEEESIFSGNNCPGFVPADDIPGDVTYLLGLFNSTLISQYLLQVCPAKMQGYIRLNAGDLNNIPIRSVSFETPEGLRDDLCEQGDQIFDGFLRGDANLNEFTEFIDEQLKQERVDVVHDLLSSIVADMAELVEERRSLNLDLRDHLGNYSDGPTLASLNPNPPKGIAESILTETTETRDNLRVGSVKIDRDGKNLKIYLTARYKPNEEESETDRWGYTESDPLPVMEFSNLGKTEADLIEVFVPLGVDEAGGFASFRETATKTNSLVDRLEDLTLPAVDDVADGLERYLDTKARAEELEGKIDKTDELIDQIVYELYGLTEEEIEVVEDAVVD